MKKELRHFADQGWQGPINTLYFGGGTPSILSVSEIESFVGQVAALFDLDSAAEITLEANPDDLTAEKMQELTGSVGESAERGYTIL